MAWSTGTRLPLALCLALTGCTGVFLQPDRVLHDRPQRLGAKWEEAKFSSADGTPLTGLWFPAQGARKGTIVHFHGNGENMTSHYLFVYWLALEGWDLLVWDYRGYGASGGKKSIAGSVEDGVAALAWARAKAPGPLVVIGQSLGGALALAALERDGGEGVKAVVLDSTFASYRALAQDKLSRLWLTWPLQWPLSRLLISDRFKPSRLAARRKPAPLLVLHAEGDPVVPAVHGRALYEAAAGPKEFWPVPGAGHTDAFHRLGPEFRPRLLKWLDEAVEK